MRQLAEPALGRAGAVHLRRVEERRASGHARVEGALLLVAVRRAAAVGELGRGPAGAARGSPQVMAPTPIRGTTTSVLPRVAAGSVMSVSIRRTSQRLQVPTIV